MRAVDLIAHIFGSKELGSPVGDLSIFSLVL
jgi:hypothetical protein